MFMDYANEDYRQILDQEVQKRKGLGSPITFSRLAEDTGIQNTYLSKVVNSRAHFNADQLYLIANALDFAEEEIEYLLLLLDWERCEVPSRKEKLRKEIDRIQNSKRKTENRIESKTVAELQTDHLEYYLDPYMQVVHVVLELPSVDGRAEKICELLGLGGAHVSRLLLTLEKLGYIKTDKDGRFVVTKKHFHLPKESSVCFAHQALLKMRSLDHMQKLDPDDRESVSITFSCDQETLKKVHENFLQFLKQCQDLVIPAKCENAYQMNFDLFRWDVEK